MLRTLILVQLGECQSMTNCPKRWCGKGQTLLLILKTDGNSLEMVQGRDIFTIENEYHM